jgi:hypothetical protein
VRLINLKIFNTGKGFIVLIRMGKNVGYLKTVLKKDLTILAL